MMKRVATLAIVALSLLSAGKNYIPAPSEPIPVPAPAPLKVPLGFYLGAGFTYAESDCECEEIQLSNGQRTASGVTATTKGLNLRAGYNFNRYLGLEAKYIYTPWGDEDKTLKHYGLYLKPSYSITDKLDVYALLGYGVTDCEILPDDEKGFAWGVGASYNFNERAQNDRKQGLGVFVEYLRPIKKTEGKKITVDMVNGGLEYNW
jgi:opacity protein-like surface antigen